MHAILTTIAGLKLLGTTLTRLGLIIVTVWGGAHKIFEDEAQGIIPYCGQ